MTIGYSALEKSDLFSHWNKIKNKKIEVPFVLIHASNENWGMFSTLMPNRTGNWVLIVVNLIMCFFFLKLNCLVHITFCHLKCCMIYY